MRARLLEDGTNAICLKIDVLQLFAPKVRTVEHATAFYPHVINIFFDVADVHDIPVLSYRKDQAALLNLRAGNRAICFCYGSTAQQVGDRRRDRLPSSSPVYSENGHRAVFRPSSA